MSGRHEAPPVGSAAREATAPPYHGTHRGTFLDWMMTEDIDRCPSCGHLYADECECLCCSDDHKEAITDV